MRNEIIFFFIIILIISLNSCKEPLGKMDLTNAGVEDIIGINLSSSNPNIDINFTGVNLSSHAVHGTINIKALEKYNSPFLTIEKQELVLYKSIPGNVRIEKSFKKYIDNKLVVDDTEIIQPVKNMESTQISNLPSWLSAFILSLGAIYLIFKKLKSIFFKGKEL